MELLRYWFLFNKFCRDAWISLEVCRRVYHCKIQVKFDIGNHLQNFGRVMALYNLVLVIVVKYRIKIQDKDIVSSQ